MKTRLKTHISAWKIDGIELLFQVVASFIHSSTTHYSFIIHPLFVHNSFKNDHSFIRSADICMEKLGPMMACISPFSAEPDNSSAVSHILMGVIVDA